jgi:hypothetical protein
MIPSVGQSRHGLSRVGVLNHEEGRASVPICGHGQGKAHRAEPIHESIREHAIGRLDAMNAHGIDDVLPALRHVNRGQRRGAHLEAARIRPEGEVFEIELEHPLHGEPRGQARGERGDEFLPHIEIGKPRPTQKPLEGPRRVDVHPGRLDVERDLARTLIAVDQREGPHAPGDVGQRREGPARTPS